MILVSGSLAYDRIMNFPGYFRDHLLPEKLHQISVSFFIDKMQEHFGGTAGNIAYNLALLGEKPVILASAGNDYAAYRKWQIKNKINVSFVEQHRDIPTAAAYIMTDKADNQITGFHPGAMQYHVICNMKHVTKSAKLAIVSPGNLDDMRALPKLYRKYGVPYIYDPGQVIPALAKRDLIDGMTGAKALIVNDYELAMVQKKTGFRKQQMLARVEMLVTTLGEKGSVIEVKSPTAAAGSRYGGRKSIKSSANWRIESHRILAVKAKKVVDPTGAGDAYRAGFIYGLLRGWSLQKVGRFAATLAVYTVEKVGTQTHHCTVRDVLRRSGAT